MLLQPYLTAAENEAKEIQGTVLHHFTEGDIVHTIVL